MLIGVIADDFTGGSDIANTLARGLPPEGGLHTALYAGVPSGPAGNGIEAGVIALKSRTIPVERAVAQSLAALDWLRAQGCRQILFKYCSTFDSTPDGNIGPVAEALAEALGVRGVVVCPAFPAAGRRVFQGHLVVQDRLLSESGMQDHPLTPMTDPDIRRFLARQTMGPVGHIPLETVAEGAASVAAALSQAEQVLCVVDAISDADLATIGQALDGAPLVTGGSGIAQGLPGNLIRAGLAHDGKVAQVAAPGPAAILAGSCSGATRGQIAHHARSNPTLSIDVSEVMNGTMTPEMLVSFFEANSGAPLVYSSGTPAAVAAIQARFGREAVARQLDILFADTAKMLLCRGYRRIVVAGGETSGAVAQAVCAELEVEALTVGPEIAPGVPVLFPAHGMALVLKSGNFGGPEFFWEALHVMERQP